MLFIFLVVVLSTFCSTTFVSGDDEYKFRRCYVSILNKLNFFEEGKNHMPTENTVGDVTAFLNSGRDVDYAVDHAYTNFCTRRKGYDNGFIMSEDWVYKKRMFEAIYICL